MQRSRRAFTWLARVFSWYGGARSAVPFRDTVSGHEHPQAAETRVEYSGGGDSKLDTRAEIASDFDLGRMQRAGGRKLRFQSIVALGALALPAWAQYAGPAILSRGDAPAAMTGAPISFRPFFEVSAIYDTGLAGVGVNSQGDLGTTVSPGIQVAGGISGSHSWRHTTVGLDYHGDLNHYFKTTFFDHSDQFLMLNVKHQFTRHIILNLRETGGLFDQNFNIGFIEQALPYDPSQTTLPTTDFFDNRTEYLNTQADLIYQRSSRLSFDFGGSGYINRRRSTALYGITGASASGDVQYRLSRRTTIGANYHYEHFSFTRIFSSTDLHSVAGTFAMRISKTLEITGYGGFTRSEAKFVQVVPVDPAIAALLGIVAAQEVNYSIRYVPNLNGRLSRTVHNGLVYISGGHLVTPGNGLFLTSVQTTGVLGYNYTGLRRWSFSLTGIYNKATSFSNIGGNYGNFGGSINASRQIARNFHMVMSFTTNKYTSTTFAQYNRPIYQARIGFGWSPGDIPLRVW